MNKVGHTYILIAILVSIGLSATTNAQTVEEYQAAVAAARQSPKGTCLAIPQSDLRDRCQRASDFVEQDCKRNPHKCDGLENKRLAANIADIESNIQDLKKAKEDQEREELNAKDGEKSKFQNNITQLKSKIEEQSQKVEEKKKELATNQSDAGIRADQGRRCLEARSDVQYLVDQAKGIVTGDRRIPEKQPYADELLAYWATTDKNHLTQMEEVKNSIKYCDECRSGDQ